MIIWTFISLSAAGQKGYIEIVPFHNSWAINELFKINFSKESKFGYTIVTQFSALYSDLEDFHMLMINDLSYALPKSLGITLGAVYTRENSFRPSLGLQYLCPSCTMGKVNTGISCKILLHTVFRVAASVANSFERPETYQLHILG